MPWWSFADGYSGMRDAAGLQGGAGEVRAALEGQDQMSDMPGMKTVIKTGEGGRQEGRLEGGKGGRGGMPLTRCGLECCGGARWVSVRCMSFVMGALLPARASKAQPDCVLAYNTKCALSYISTHAPPLDRHHPQSHPPHTHAHTLSFPCSCPSPN